MSTSREPGAAAEKATSIIVITEFIYKEREDEHKHFFECGVVSEIDGEAGQKYGSGY